MQEYLILLHFRCILMLALYVMPLPTILVYSEHFITVLSEWALPHDFVIYAGCSLVGWHKLDLNNAWILILKSITNSSIERG